MDYGQISSLSMMKAKMAYSSQRHRLLSENISHIDTPGFRAQDLAPFKFDQMASAHFAKLQMRQTQSTHLQPANRSNDAWRAQQTRSFYEKTPTNNNISSEEQSKKMALNQMEYITVSNLYQKTTGLFKTALGTR